MGMDRMFRVLAFWVFIIALMFLAGGMTVTAMLFFAQTAFFLIVSYLPITERGYMYIFGGYMVVAFVGIVFWSFFVGVGGGAAA